MQCGFFLNEKDLYELKWSDLRAILLSEKERYKWVL